MRTLRYGLLGLLALTTVPRIVCAQDDRPTVAVIKVDVANIGNKDPGELANALVDMLTTELAKKQTVRVIDRNEVQNVLTKQMAQLSGHVSDEQAAQIAKLVGAAYFVNGSAVMVGPQVRLDIRLINSETSEISRSYKQSGKTDDLLTLVDQIADNFTKDLKLPARVVVAAEQTWPATAVLAYARGLDYEKRGKKAQAVQMYQKTLQLAPTYEDAQKALARVK